MSGRARFATIIASLQCVSSSTLHANQVQTYGCNAQTFYTFDWENVYQLDRKLPQGCTCSNSMTTDNECELFDCKCGCDLTAGVCDPNCCCDPDCSAGEVERFEMSDVGCLLHENEPAFQGCYNAEAVGCCFALFSAAL